MAESNPPVLGTQYSVLSTQHAAPPSLLRAWLFLVWLSWQRQARVRHMVWISVALLVLTALAVLAQTLSFGWGMERWGWRSQGRWLGLTYEQAFGETYAATSVVGPLGSPRAAGLGDGLVQAGWAVLKRTDFIRFSRGVFSIFLSFLLPLWSLSFGTEALGGDREGHSLLWLLTRPLPRPAIYLAKYVALLPWTLVLNLGGFAVVCAAAGRPGWQALRLFWPAVLCATLAFAALFHLIGAWFRRPAIIALVYAFFLETIMGNMPGYFKRVSISFYTRCMMYDAAGTYGVQPESPSIFLPVSGTTAAVVLLAATALLLLVGTYLFNRTEYVAAE
ncbi:MAG TPA: ABC transporter permease subunit [Gemmataceae bacterium]|nr:ABC transporter permease subunit [Gemmataceae bacterium]